MNSVAHHNPYMYILPERITSSLLETPENKKQAQFYFEFYLSSKISSFTELKCSVSPSISLLLCVAGGVTCLLHCLLTTSTFKLLQHDRSS